MNAPQQTQCFDRLTLERLLAEQLQGDEETAVLVHIETCEGCRNQLAAIAGHAELDPEIREHFTDESFDGPGAATVLEGEAEEADIEQIKALLGPTDDPQMLGRIGHYEINGIVGRGSTGIVFKATDKRLNRFVAIKMLAPSYAGSGPARQRFAREARSIAAVRDEHVIPVFGVDEHKGLPFIVMEYMPGGSLAQGIEEQGRLDTCEVVRLGMQIARALQAAHAQGIVHRDVKPANVLLEAGIDRALVTDFGLARILDESSMTRSGAISGTPQFMSPEQAAGESVDHRSDLFSLGSVMYMACTGHSPFRSETVFGVIKRVCENEPRPIRETNPGIKQWLCDFVQKLQAKDVTQRFQSAKEVADYLAAELAYLQSPTSIPKPNRLWRPEPVPTTTDKTPARKLAVAASVVGVVAFAIFGLSQLQSGAKDQEPPANGGQVKTLAAQDKQDLPKAGLQLALAASGEEPKQPSEFERAVVFLDAKEYDEAIQLFKSSFDDNENEGESAYNIACCYALSDRAGDAIPWLEKAIEAGFINTNHYKSDTDLKSLRGTDKFEELLARMQKIERAEKLVARGVQLRRQGRYVDANEVYIEVLDQFPTNSAAILEYGLSLHLKGDLDEALKWHRRAAETKETADYGNYNIACYHSLKGQTDKAFEYFRKGIKAGMTDIRHFEEDSDLDAIRDDPRYQTMLHLAESELRKSWSDEEKQCHRMIVAVKTKDYNTLERLLQDADKNCSCPDPRSV
ncbi:MAG: protein kinase, partial [Planctomycetaceae bacterium]